MEQICTGWLTKSPPERKTLKLFRWQWRRRYFVLYAPPSPTSASLTESSIAVFEYYDNERLTHRRGCIDLTHCDQVRVQQDSTFYPFVFSMKTKHRGHDRVYFLAADSQNEMNNWVECLTRVLHLDNTAGQHTEIVCNVDNEQRYTATPVRQVPVVESVSSSSQAATETGDQDTYILLDECYSGSTKPPAADQQYYNLNNSVEQSAESEQSLYQTPRPPSSSVDLLSGILPKLCSTSDVICSRHSSQSSAISAVRNTSDSCEYDIPTSPQSIDRQESETDEAIWNCHSRVAAPQIHPRGSKSPAAAVEQLMRPDSSSEYDIPPPPLHQAHLGSVIHPLTPPQTPKSHGAKYINTPPLPARQMPGTAVDMKADSKPLVRDQLIKPITSAATSSDQLRTMNNSCTQRAQSSESNSDESSSEDMKSSKQSTTRHVSGVQYVDLDLDNSASAHKPAERSPAVPSTDTEYNEIDWLKTNALISTKKQLETKRKT